MVVKDRNGVRRPKHTLFTLLQDKTNLKSPQRKKLLPAETNLY